MVHSETLRERLRVHLALLCANLGCDAIEARVLFSAGSSSIVEHAAAGAADGDVARLKRWPRPPELPR
ncbi:hypothetical protein [Reyranella sp.]|uniref:hypothetical protein n=1 Tax=Reyranella sp. TaxID=1929291 RepID=UPI003D130CFC